MSAQQWTEKQTKEVMKKVIRRAEVSRIARLLQHRLALANVKTQNGWENLTLDAIEPKVDEDLKRKRQRSAGKSPTPEETFLAASGRSDWSRRYSQATVTTHNNPRPPSRPRTAAAAVDFVGPLPTFPPRTTATRKRSRTTTAATSSSSTSSNKRHQNERHGRLIQSSPGYQDMSQPPQHSHNTQPVFHSSPPRTPPRRMIKPIRNAGEEGADLLLYLATSPSPAMTKSRFIPTTPPSKHASLPSSMMPAPQTPQNVFNFSDFVNITPSPAQGAFGSAARATPIAHARRKLNFDQLAPPEPQVQGAGFRIELGGQLAV